MILAITATDQIYSAEEPPPSVFPSLLPYLELAAPIHFCGELVPIEIPEVREDLEKELMLILWDRPQVLLWLKRSGRYFPYIEKMLKENGLPDDLKYVAVIESSLRPHIGSWKRAIGYWQFIRSTGRRYGLQIDTYSDERRNIFTSTMAAIRYYQKLYDDFGSWTLATAAYNMGEHGLEENIREQKTDNFYHLYLPIETQRHIHKIIAAKLIFSNPKRYGFHLKKTDYYPPLSFDTIEIECTVQTPIQLVAEAASTYFKTIKDLNPQLRGRYLQQGRHVLAIPKGNKKGYDERFKQLYQAWISDHPENMEQIVYVVQKGDSLSLIASRHNVRVSDLLEWNRMEYYKTIHPGDRLVIYKKP